MAASHSPSEPAPSRVVRMDQARRVLEPRYRLLERVGTGAASAVFKVVDQANADAVRAAKVVSLGADGNESFQHVCSEFRVGRRFDHPNLIRAYDLEISSDRTHVAVTTEFFEGENLSRGVTHGDWRRAGRLLVELLRGLQCLHEAGIIHADIKPSNILCRWDGREPALKLLDYHLSVRKADLAMAQTRGTLLYMAPEVIGGRSAGVRSDLYSVGVVLHEVLSGEPPFKGAPGEVAARHMRDSIPLPAGLEGENARQLGRILKRMLAKNPDARYDTSTEIIREILKILPGEHRPESIATLLGRVRSAPTVGRDGLIGRAKDVIEADEKESSRPLAVIVEGGQGAGKTRILREIQTESQIGGSRTILLSGQDQPEEVLNKLAGSLDPNETVATQAVEYGERLDGKLSPALLARADEIGDLLAGMNGEKALVVLIDDLDQAGSELLELISFLLRSASGRPVSWFLATRPPEECPGPVEKWLNSWTAEESLPQLHADDLRLSQRRELLESVLPEITSDDIVESVARACGGRPGLLAATIEHMITTGAIRACPDGSVEVPGDVADGLPENFHEFARRLMRDSDPVLGRAVRLLAVAEEPLEIEVLAEASGCSVACLSNEVLPGPAADLIFCSSGATRLTCELQHAGIGRAIRQDIAPDDCRVLHDLCADALCRCTPPNDAHEEIRIARHQLLGNQRQRGVERLLKALPDVVSEGRDRSGVSEAIELGLNYAEGEQRGRLAEIGGYFFSAGGDFARAAQLLEDALSSDAALREPQRAVRKMAHSLALSGEKDRSRQQLKACLQQYQDSPAITSRIHLLLSDIETQDGQFARAEKHFSAACRLAEDVDDKQILARALMHLGREQIRTRDLDAALETLRGCCRLLEESGDAVGRGLALSWLSSALILKGETTEAKSRLSRSMDILRSHGRLAEAARALNKLGAIGQKECQWDEAARNYESALDIYNRMGCEEGPQAVLVNLSQVNISRGQVERGLECAQQVLDMPGDQAHWGCHARLRLAWGYSFLGRQNVAKRHAREALGMAEERDYPKLREAALRRLGQIAQLCGRHAEARKLLQRALAEGEAEGYTGRRAVATLRLSEVLVCLGDLDAAMRQAEEAGRLAEESGIESIVCLARGARGKVLLARNQPREALDELRPPARFFADRHMCEELIHAAYHLGRAHMQSGGMRNGLRYYGIALDTIEEIAEKMGSRENRRIFVEDERRIRVFDAVKEARRRINPHFSRTYKED